jgi:hypothetical protein
MIRRHKIYKRIKDGKILVRQSKRELSRRDKTVPFATKRSVNRLRIKSED